MNYFQLLVKLRLAIIREYGSQKDFAREFGIDAGNLSKILTGVIKPRFMLVFQMCDFLGYKIDIIPKN